MNILYMSAFVAYFAFFLGLSFYFYRKAGTASSFMLGNRSLNYWVTALATQASDMSDWLFMAYPGLIYAFGLFDLWVAIGLLLFMFLNWHFIAPRLRLATEKYESITLASYFERRFADHSGALRLMSVFFTLFFIVYYVGAELVGLGRLFETTFGIHYNAGVGISIILVVANIILGGFTARAWSDMFRGVFLLAMIILVPIVALYNLPLSSASVLSQLSSSTFFNQLIPDYSWSTLQRILLLSTGWGLGYFGSPHILINFMGIKDPANMYKAKYVGLTWQALVLAAATCVGVIGTLFFTNPLANRELVFIEMVKTLFTPLFAGFILCAVLAATMSVMTAQILATASIVSEDFFKRIASKSLSDKQELLLIRGCIIALPLLAYAVSYNSTSSINDLVSYAWSGLGLSFAPAVIAALFIPSANKYGVGAAMLFGGLMGMVWPSLRFGFMPLLPGFTIALILLVIVSYLTRSKEPIKGT